MTDRDFIKDLRDRVFNVQCVLSSDGPIWDGLEEIVRDCEKRMSVDYFGCVGIVRVYPAVNSNTMQTVEIDLPYRKNDRTVTCRPEDVESAVENLRERFRGK